MDIIKFIIAVFITLTVLIANLYLVNYFKKPFLIPIVVIIDLYTLLYFLLIIGMILSDIQFSVKETITLYFDWIPRLIQFVRLHS